MHLKSVEILSHCRNGDWPECSCYSPLAFQKRTNQRSVSCQQTGHIPYLLNCFPEAFRVRECKPPKANVAISSQCMVGMFGLQVHEGIRSAVGQKEISISTSMHIR